jgi:prepilin-type N-terminal cleavage/methylation domain-containing protein
MNYPCPPSRKSSTNHYLRIINHQVIASGARQPPSFINRKGFTLVELLVVISIIGLLLSLLMPSLQRVRRQTKAVGCQSNRRQWGTFYCASVAEGDAEAFATIFGQNLSPYTSIDWCLTLQRAYGDQARGLLLCPMAPRPDAKEVTRPADGDRFRGGFGSTFFAWWAIEKEGALCASSYGMNYHVLGDTFPGTFSAAAPPQHAILHRVPLWDTGAWGPTRASAPVMFDCAWQQVYLTMKKDGDPPPFEGFPNGVGSLCINRHDAGVNHLFLDWSVRKVGLKELWTLKWDRAWDTAGPWTTRGGVRPEDWPEWMRKFKDY